MILNYILITFFFLSFIAIILFFGPNRWDRMYKNFTLLVSIVIFIYSMNIWINCSWVFGNYVIESSYLNLFNIQCVFAVDVISIFFIILTTFLFPFCILAAWEMTFVRILFLNMVLIELGLLITFTVFDLFLFCLSFEAVLIPMFFIILWWGSRERRIKAITYFFLYTLLGSVFLFMVLFIIYFEIGSTSFFAILIWTAEKQGFVTGFFLFNCIYLLLFFVFAIKIPVFPFHIWLPEAHVEAPTVGSVILAGLLLKLGGYGILRFSYMFLVSLEYWQTLILFLVVLSIWLGSILAVRQMDLKRTIAYSSIAHMNFALVGFFTNNVLGVVGAYSLLVSHGIVSSALFLLIGFLYDRHHTRLIHYYGGLVQTMPLWVFFFFVFIISNFSFPGTSNFIGELFIFLSIGSFLIHPVLLIVAASSTFLTVVYSLFLFNRVSFGSLKIRYISAFSDITRREFFIILPLFFFNLIFGLFPNIFLSPIYYSAVLMLTPSWPSEFFFNTAPTKRVLLIPEDLFNISMVELNNRIDLYFLKWSPEDSHMLNLVIGKAGVSMSMYTNDITTESQDNYLRKAYVIDTFAGIHSCNLNEFLQPYGMGRGMFIYMRDCMLDWFYIAEPQLPLEGVMFPLELYEHTLESSGMPLDVLNPDTRGTHPILVKMDLSGFPELRILRNDYESYLERDRIATAFLYRESPFFIKDYSQFFKN